LAVIDSTKSARPRECVRAHYCFISVRSNTTSCGLLSSRQPKKVVSLNSLIASDVPAGAKPSASKGGVLQMATESEADSIVFAQRSDSFSTTGISWKELPLKSDGHA
jgi:hypothetical protein